jgi:hypothetical protein
MNAPTTPNTTAAKDLLDLAVTLLNDEYGISEEAYMKLHKMLLDAGFGPYNILRRVDATDGRFYLPERLELDPMQ